MKIIDADAFEKYAWGNPDIEVDGEPYISPSTVQNFAADHPITIDPPNEPLTLEQLHVCPLQLDIVDRIINRYSNPGDLVFDPFGGLGTVPLEAIKAGRRGYMCELNPDYFRDAVGYLKAEEEKQEALTLFDLLGEG